MIQRLWLPLTLLLFLGLGVVGGLLLASGPGVPPASAPVVVNAEPGLGCPAITRASPLPREASAEQLESPEWRSRNAALTVQLASQDNSRAGIVFIGDSITQYFDPGLWRQFHGHRNPVNLGLWGDFTQGALWRLTNGQWGSMQPRAAVILLGTNNTQWGGRAEDVAQGVAELVRYIHSRSPRTKVLVMGLLPRGATAAEPLRAVNARVNAQLARCADGVNTFFLDIGPWLLDREGNLSEQVSFDRLHLTMVGYAIMGTAMEPVLRRMLGE
jgi:beta-glucosidase